MRFDNKIAIINGAAQGIGESVARKLAADGATVIITDVFADAAEKVAESIRASGKKAKSFKMNVTSTQEIDDVTKKCIEEFGRIDILVQCSGIYRQFPFLEMAEGQFEETINVNLKGTFLCTQRVAKEMVKNNYGRIVCLASVAGQRGASVGNSHYGASKAGVIALCKTMANELAPYNINVNLVAPGIIATNMTKKVTANDEALKTFAIKRYGSAEEVADSVLFLASKDADYITGATIDVNGGMFMR